MTAARDIMTQDATCVRSSESIVDAAVRMAELGVGALPICGEDDRLKTRRLPVIDGHTLVGIVALADVSRHLEDPDVGLILDAISTN